MSDQLLDQTPPLNPKSDSSNAKSYNDVFERLVDGHEEEEIGEHLVGMLAYSLYKQQKREFVSHYLDRHGTCPSPADLSTWALGCRETQLNNLRHTARSLLLTFAVDFHEQQLEEQRDRIYQTVHTNHFSGLNDRLKAQESLIGGRLDNVKSETSAVGESLGSVKTQLTGLVDSMRSTRLLGWNILGGFLGTVLAILLALALQSDLGRGLISSMIPSSTSSASPPAPSAP